MTWAGGGILLGLLGAWAASRTIAGLLFATSAADPFTFGITAFALGAVAALACLVPAVRATRIDPVTALRGD
jgi:ABC-type antimicrobial peptide transport system permease subunit